VTQHTDQTDHSRYGSVHERADGYQLRFERQLLQPVERVWAALSSPAQLAQWLAPGEIELTLGGRVSLAFTDGDGVIDGRVTAIAPPRLLEFTWTDKGDDLVSSSPTPSPNLPAGLVSPCSQGGIPCSTSWRPCSAASPCLPRGNAGKSCMTTTPGWG
jgi:uncharacterized protein YndB with AHSA1/START domain